MINNKGYTYVMSDLHGCFEEFISMLIEIEFDDTRDHLYILGDVIDKGKYGIEILKFLMENKDSMTLIKGNHEDIMFQCISKKESLNEWFVNGGKNTFLNFNKLRRKEQNKIHAFLYNTIFYKRITVNDKEYFLSHAGLIYNPNLDLEEIILLNEKMKETFLWTRNKEMFLDVKIKHDINFVFGHTPVEYLHEYIDDMNEEEKIRCNESKIYIGDKKICLDTGAANKKKIGCLRLNDMKEFYININ